MEQQNEKRKSCILFKSIVDAAEELDKDQALELLLTYAHYGLGETIDLDKCSKIVRLILLQNIEALNAADRRYQASKLNGPKGKENGGGVGRPRKNETPEEYQKRVEEWKRSKNPQETPKNPQVVSCTETPTKPLKTPDNNPIKNPVIQKSPLECSQNPQKPLNVDVDVEVDKEEDKYKEKDIYKEISKEEYTFEEFTALLKELCLTFIRKHGDYNYLLDDETFETYYYDNIVRFQLFVKEELHRDISINDCVLLILGYANEQGLSA